MLKKNKGITLISLIILIIIMIILGTVSIYSGTNTIRYSKYMRAKSEMQTLQAQVNSWYEDYNSGKSEVLEYGTYDELMKNKTSALYKLTRKPSTKLERIAK